MTRTVSRFDRAVSEMRSAIRRKIRRSELTSALDVADVSPALKGSIRGAAVRKVFSQLETEGVIRVTDDVVYNNRTRNSVSVYRRA